MGDQARTGAPNFFHRQLHPEVVAGVAVIKGGDSPSHLGAFRVVGGVVVPAVISQLLHKEGQRPGRSVAFNVGGFTDDNPRRCSQA